MWGHADVAEIANFHANGSDHRPVVRAKALYDDNAIYLAFRVNDRFVRAVHTNYNDMVCRDSCVEFFVEPKPDAGYFNFEVNCGGTVLLSYVEDPTRVPGGFAKFSRVPELLGGTIRMYHSMPKRGGTGDR